MQIHCLKDVQTVLTDAFEAGLRQKYGADFARLFRDVIEYRPRVDLDVAELHRCVELDTTPVLKDIVANQVTGATLRAVRSLLIACALLADRTGVERWATELLNRCSQGGGDWPATTAQWQAVMKDPLQFIQVARQIKYFLNQA
ncbi:MAG: hypothetical protein PCFJNLEI_01324 [Verrucomicrobiae bacterium]|nr:hypothetical protein [Verrucomicrobiae bacterium]